MQFTYRLIRERGGYLAECIESEAAGEGKSPREAIESLRRSLHERMFRPDAIAPPPSSVETRIELTLTEDGASRSDAKASA